MSVIALDIADGVAHLRLNRPEASNAFDLPTANAFAAAVEQVANDAKVRAIVLTGAGKRFCAGGDVASFVAVEDRSLYLRELADVLDGALQHLAAIPKPVVAAVHGAVAGAGLGVMLSADLIIAEPATRFVAAYSGIGLTPDCGVSWLLPRAIGTPRAMEMLVGARALNAAEALEWGLIGRLAETDAASEGIALAQQLATGPAEAFGQTRRLVRAAWEVDRATSGSQESATIAGRIATAEAEALVSAFLNR